MVLEKTLNKRLKPANPKEILQGVGEAPWGSRAQMLGFCFLDILLSTREGLCVSGHMGTLLVYGDQTEKETISWTP